MKQNKIQLLLQLELKVRILCVSGYRGGLIWWQSPKANIPLGNGIHAQQPQVDPEIPK